MSHLSEPAKALWGKSDREKNDGSWHPLIHHMLDVAACAEAILEREPSSTRKLYAQDLGFSKYEQAKPWLLSFITLHDLGKASPTFQTLWPTGANLVRQQGLTWQRKPDYVPHGFISQLVMGEENNPLKTSLAYDLLKQTADAVGCHHGLRASPSELDNVGSCELGREKWESIRLELIEVTLKLFKANLSEAPSISELSSAAFYRLAGLTSFADWIGSNQDFFDFVAPVEDIGNYYSSSLEKARKALDRIGWRVRKALKEDRVAFEQIAFDKDGKTYKPRPLQQAVVELLEKSNEPTLLLIEAPMGEGKTEAAFYSHVRLQQTLKHRGMYVALPTRATGNAMFKRTKGFLEGMGRYETIDLQLLHGAALLNDDYQNIRVRQIDEGNSTNAKGAVEAQEWFSNKKRAQLSEYGVGTVDQALLSILPIKHNFVRMWGLGNRTIVIDEVHAYDTYTSSLIEVLLSWLYALGSSVIVMSATLPKDRREALLKTYGVKEVPQEVCYPRVYKVSGSELEFKSFESDPERRIWLELKAAPVSFVNLVPQIFSNVKDGGCVACIVNTVERAQQLYRALEGEAKTIDVELFLFHARYPAEQRQKIEDEILDLFGKQGKRPSKAILIGTQVLEQSLDLDFDVMFTDLAPVDLILQRAGRIWRHKRDNRAKSQVKPMLYVMGLEQNIEVPDFKNEEYLPDKKVYWESVYDRTILLRTYALLKDKRELTLPDDIDPFVETIYAEAIPKNTPPDIVKPIQEAALKLDKKRQEDLAEAAKAAIGMPSDGSWLNVPNLEQYDPEENPEKHKSLLAKTRLGDPTVTIIPIHDLGDGNFKCAGKEFRLDDSLEGKWKLAKSLYLQNISISCKDLLVDFWKTERPESWQKHPLLRNCYPLILIDRKAILNNLEVELNDLLGILYHKLPS